MRGNARAQLVMPYKALYCVNSTMSASWMEGHMGHPPLTDDACLLWSQHNVFNDVDHGWAQGQKRLQTLRGSHGVHSGKGSHSI